MELIWKLEDVLGSYEVDPSILNNKISSFYLDSERRPKEFSLEINSWRYWDVYMWGLDFKRVSFVRPKVKEGFVNTERILVKGESLEIGYDNDGEIKPKDLQDVDLNIGYLPRFAEVEVDENPQAVAQVISWRDSILEDNKCEKFLDLTVKVNKEEKPLRYAVRKVDNYIFIDLNKPVYEGKKQEWDKEDCFGVENYEDDKNVDVDLKYSVKVNFKEKGDYFFSKDIDSFVVFDSLKNSWSYFNFGQIARDEYSRLHGRSLYEGLNLLFDSNNGLFKKFRANSLRIWFSSNSNPDYHSWNNFDKYSDFKDKDFYDLLTEYYTIKEVKNA